MPDEVVHHPKYGRGVVKGRHHRGLDLYVAFDDGRRRWVRVTELEQPSTRRAPAGEERLPAPKPVASLLRPARQKAPERAVPPRPPKASPIAHAPKPQAAPRRLPPIEEAPRPEASPFRSRRIVEALRMGIVPDDCVVEITTGRDREIACLGQWLREDSGSALVVGNYGSGKSHLLRYLATEALRLRYAVAWVQMEPNEAPLHKPKRIYRSVASSLRYRSPNGSGLLGYRDLLQQSLDSGALRDHPYFRRLRDDAARSDEFRELFWDWIEAAEDPPRPVAWQEDCRGYRYNRFGYVPPLHTHTTTANIYCNLLSALAWSATHVLGLSGLVVFVDEAESLDVSATTRQVEMGANFLAGLMRVAANDRRLLDAPLHSGLKYSRTSLGPTIPFLYREPCGLRLVWALTPTPLLDQIPELRSAFRLNLTTLDEQALSALYTRVREHYCRAYSFDLGEKYGSLTTILEQMLATCEGDTRYWVKAYIEQLDAFRYKMTRNGDG